MRRLPVYLLVDTSGSMHGEAIEAVRNGLQVLVSALRQDPYALETAYLSVITFNSSAQQIIPLTELMNFQVPDIQASGTTAMGEALTLLHEPTTTPLSQLCVKLLNKYEQPRHYLCIPHLPLTATGKPARAEAARLARTQLKGNAL